MTGGRPSSLLLGFSLPLVLGNLFQQLYNIADSLVAGKFIGENALAAVGNSYNITLIFIAFAFGSNIGCSVIVSQLFGAKDLQNQSFLFFILHRKYIIPPNPSSSYLFIAAFHIRVPSCTNYIQLLPYISRYL